MWRGGGEAGLAGASAEPSGAQRGSSGTKQERVCPRPTLGPLETWGLFGTGSATFRSLSPALRAPHGSRIALARVARRGAARRFVEEAVAVGLTGRLVLLSVLKAAWPPRSPIAVGSLPRDSAACAGAAGGWPRCHRPRKRRPLVRLWALDCAGRGERGLGAFGSLGVARVRLRTEWFPFGHLSKSAQHFPAARGVVSGSGFLWRRGVSLDGAAALSVFGGTSSVVSRPSMVEPSLLRVRFVLRRRGGGCDALPRLSIGDLSLSGRSMCRSAWLFACILCGCDGVAELAASASCVSLVLSRGERVCGACW